MKGKILRIYSPKLIKKVTKKDINEIIKDLDHVIDLIKDMYPGNITHAIGNVRFILDCCNRKIKRLSNRLSEHIINVLKTLHTISSGNVSHKKPQIETVLIYVKTKLQEMEGTE